ncbi:MAG TPA: hypothetical protein VFS16_20555 [Acidimicrobiia bacterium]|nr:hypothetical protein [Acidimicrobiia bacterium]
MTTSLARSGPRLDLEPTGIAGRSDGWLVLDGREIGWYDGFEDPLLDFPTLRLWLDAAPLGGRALQTVSEHLADTLEETAGRDAVWAVEANRIFPIRGGEPASALLRFGGGPPCGDCRWRRSDCDDWFVDELVASFRDGSRRLGATPTEEQVRRYVVGTLTSYPHWQWWSLSRGADRSGVVVSGGHEDAGDGRPYAQCVDAVGRHSAHFSCLAALLSADLSCEVRGEVTLGLDRAREHQVIARLHGEGWRLRGLTSLFQARGGDVRARCR